MAGSSRGTAVFVNCPFDPGYQPLFDAVVFGITACGYSVRSALEISDSGDTRLRKIIDLLEQSAFSVHDISRMGLDAATGLPRFNMPIELGIAIGMKHLGRRALRDHKILIVDSDPFRYRKSASDLSGVDITGHGDQPATLIKAIRDFLATHAPHHLPTADAIGQLHDAFQTDLPALAAAARQKPSALTCIDRLRHIRSFFAEAAQ